MFLQDQGRQSPPTLHGSVGSIAISTYTAKCMLRILALYVAEYSGSQVLQPRHTTKRRRKQVQQSALLELPSEILVIVLDDLDHISRCAFGLTCKDICRLGCREPHNLDSVTGFTVRHEFMTFMSQHWIPHSLHFCFRCNHLREVDERTRDSWYESLVLPTPTDTTSRELQAEPSVPRPSVNTNSGAWSQWKVMVKDQQRVTAWCSSCVEITR